jgi:hypothetical protein
MEALSPQELVQIWEGARDRSLPRRALRILEEARQSLGAAELPLLSVGRRDALLLELRWRTFGRLIACVEPCPECGQQVELEIDADTLLAAMPPGHTGSLSLQRELWTLELRLPNTLDQEAVLAERDVGQARCKLLRRCCLAVSHGGSPAPFEQLPEQMLEAAEQAMAEADPLADIWFSLRCEDCEHGWSAPFDVTSLLWEECAFSAQRLLHEVHVLASAYHWSERDILALSAARRRFYLDCIGA